MDTIYKKSSKTMDNKKNFVKESHKLENNLSYMGRSRRGALVNEIQESIRRLEEHSGSKSKDIAETEPVDKFKVALKEAFEIADNTNKEILSTTFPDIFG